MIESYRTERRTEPRMLCSDLVTVHWKDRSGRNRHTVANLEDISMSGACLQLEQGLPIGTAVRVVAPGMVFRARTVYCTRNRAGCYLGLRFESGSKWSRRKYRPKHLLDPRILIAMTLRPAKRPARAAAAPPLPVQ
jgi:hypothetical protein